jgi:hypothetical protein
MSADNTADPTAFRALLGRDALDPFAIQFQFHLRGSARGAQPGGAVSGSRSRSTVIDREGQPH